MDKKSPLKIYGLLGFPVRHSLSPAMHNAAFRALNIPAEYRLFEVKPEELEGFLLNNAPISDIDGNSFRLTDLSGFNVTIPYKVKVLQIIGSILGNKVNSIAALIDAVNTVKVSADNLEAFNTDGAGFWRHLTKDLKFNLQGKKAAIIGAGGASRSVCVFLCIHKAKSISVFDVDKDKLRELVDNVLIGQFSNYNIEIKAANSIDGLNIADCDLLVNATPIGMKEDDPCLVDEKFIHKDLLVYDLIYNPAETKLLKMAEKRKARVSNGLGMLLYQGAEAFEIWTGREAPVEVMRNALNQAIKR